MRERLSSVERVRQTVEMLGGNQENIIHPPASEKNLIELQRYRRVPVDYLQFLRRCDGALFYQTDIIFGTVDGAAGVQRSVASAVDALTHLPDYLTPVADAGGITLYHDTGRMNERGECPVVAITPAGQIKDIAGSFIDYLEYEVYLKHEEPLQLPHEP